MEVPSYSSLPHQPTIKTPLVTHRTAPVTGRGPRDTEVVSNEMQDSHRLQDLEDTVMSLRRVLTNREQDVVDLQSEKNLLSEQLGHLKQVYETPTEGKDEKEKRINQLIREKENLTTEVWKLKQDMDQLKEQSKVQMTEPSTVQVGMTSQDHPEDNHLDNYTPNNPRALQRKLEDLSAQLQDLTEAHESSVQKLAHTEREAGQLKDENRTLRMAETRRYDRDVEQENRRLKDELSRHANEDGDYLRQELSTVRRDLHVLKDKNQQLMQDNIKLTEHLKRYDSRGQPDSHRNPTRIDVGRNDPLLDSDHSRWSPVKTRNEDDEQFTLNTRRITQELKQIATPSNWSDRDFYNHGEEGQQIRRANDNPFSRARSTSPTRHSDTRFSGHKDNLHSRHTEPQEDRHIDKHLYESSRKSAMLTIEGRPLERIPLEDRNGDKQTDLVDLDKRSRSHDRGLVNGYHRPVSPPSIPRERRLSDESNATTDLTNASPLGEYKHLDSRVPNGDFQHGILEECIDTDYGSDHMQASPTAFSKGSLRSVSPRPIITQHNKAALAALTRKDPVSYASKRPFAPRNPADVNLGDVVKFCRHGGKISRGQVKYIGHLPGKNDTYLGLELEHEMGKHDGVYDGNRYFQSKPNRGVFVAFSKVVMAWGD